MNELLLVTAEEAGLRLDSILANRYRELHSRTYFQFLIGENSVLVNGEIVKKQFKPKEGDEIEVQFILTPEILVAAENIPLDILYEDESIIVVNKPAGLVVHPAPGNWTGTFVNGLLYHCKELDPEGSLRPGIVHRLDKDTSGVLIAAKTLKAHQKLIEMFAGREVKKEYVALTIGNPGNRTIDAPIGRHPIERKRMAVLEEGRASKTECETLKNNENLCLVRLRPETGRTHQIRVHLRHVNAPVLGDALYGIEAANKRYSAKRQMLHARALTLSHPVTGKELLFEAPIPEDMRTLMRRWQCDL